MVRVMFIVRIWLIVVFMFKGRVSVRVRVRFIFGAKVSVRVGLRLG